MITFDNNKSIFSDVDDTLIMYTFPIEFAHRTITIDNNGWKQTVLPHYEHIEMLKRFKFLGYKVVVWSATGSQWAEKITKELGLEPYVDICMSKPGYYVDDLHGHADDILGKHIYKAVK